MFTKSRWSSCLLLFSSCRGQTDGYANIFSKHSDLPLAWTLQTSFDWTVDLGPRSICHTSDHLVYRNNISQCSILSDVTSNGRFNV
jgi:hypothetical protein